MLHNGVMEELDCPRIRLDHDESPAGNNDELHVWFPVHEELCIIRADRKSLAQLVRPERRPRGN